MLVNLTVSPAAAARHVTAHRAGTRLPQTSNVNFASALNQVNLAAVPVEADGQMVLDAHPTRSA